MTARQNEPIGDEFPEPHMEPDPFDDGTPATLGENAWLWAGMLFGVGCCGTLGFFFWQAWRAMP